MYHPVGIHQLSHSQIQKLLSGGRVRVKAGTHHKVHMVQEHAKKLHTANKKGAGIMLQLDPYARDMNSHLMGEGIKSIAKQAKHAYHKAGQFVKSHKEAFRPLASHLKQQAHQSIADATMSALDHGVDPSLVSAYSSMAHQSVPVGGSLKSFSRGLSHFVRTPAVRTVRKALRPLAQHAFNTALDVANAGIDTAGQQAMGSMAGMGIVPKSQLRKRVGRPRAGGALFPAGY